MKQRLIKKQGMQGTAGLPQDGHVVGSSSESVTQYSSYLYKLVQMFYQVKYERREIAKEV